MRSHVEALPRRGSKDGRRAPDGEERVLHGVLGQRRRRAGSGARGRRRPGRSGRRAPPSASSSARATSASTSSSVSCASGGGIGGPPSLRAAAAAIDSEDVRHERERAERVPGAEAEAERPERGHDPGEGPLHPRTAEHVRRSPVESTAIEIAVQPAKSASATSASTWLWIAASSSTPTPPLPPIPWTRPIPYACHGVRCGGTRRCVWSWAKAPRRQRRSSQSASAMITKPDRHLGALLDRGPAGTPSRARSARRARGATTRGRGPR